MTHGSGGGALHPHVRRVGNLRALSRPDRGIEVAGGLIGARMPGMAPAVLSRSTRTGLLEPIPERPAHRIDHESPPPGTSARRRDGAAKEPITSNSNTQPIRTRPGSRASHHAPAVRYPIDSARMTPMAGTSGERPNPRKVIEASCRMACGKDRTIPTMSCGTTAGSRCRAARRHRETPNAALTLRYGSHLACINSARRTRARPGQCVSDTPTATPQNPRPRE